MSKPKYSQDQIINACVDYLSGRKTAIQLAIELQMGKHGRGEIRLWAKKYELHGASAFICSPHNNSYTKEFKESVVKEYSNGSLSPNNLVVKYNIPSKSTLMNWIKKYNNHIEIKDYHPELEVYMADTLKTTYEERIEIVKYCLAHDRDIKGTATRYSCNYAQLYQWVRKYEANGEIALTDKRGIRKKENELTELAKAERKVSQLEREKEEYRKKYELLKKAEERERW
jgi:transposase-like protein